MPEGHTVHRIALQFRADFVGERVAASSPQGRFAAGAALLDGAVMVEARAVGKQLFLAFDNERWLRVHLGLYGAWDFHGRISPIADGVEARGSFGAPRVTRALRMGEGEQPMAGGEVAFPPDPVGAVRVRLLTEKSLADLRGPTACEVLTAPQVRDVHDRLGADPLRRDADPEAAWQRLRRSRTPVGALLMQQDLVAGVGNVYRAEVLFRAGLDPHRPGSAVDRETWDRLWADLAALMRAGVRAGRIVTTRPEHRVRRSGPASREDAHYVYRRTGLPCRVCGTPVVAEPFVARTLYRCPVCQAA